MEAALVSLLSQTFSDFEIIISDNASTDQTEAICREYASRDRRIQYHRQPKNMGALANFNFVLKKADAAYFMWASADDRRSEGYLEKNISFLCDNPEYVASTSPTQFEGGQFDALAMGDRSLEEEDAGSRLRGFFGVWHANGSFYSLMRTDVIQKCDLLGEDFFALDWAIVLYIAKVGKLRRIESEWVELGRGGASGDENYLKKVRSGPLEYVLPFWRFSIVALKLCRGESLSTYAGVLFSCAQMNARAFRALHEGNLYRLYKYLRQRITQP